MDIHQGQKHTRQVVVALQQKYSEKKRIPDPVHLFFTIEDRGLSKLIHKTISISEYFPIVVSRDVLSSMLRSPYRLVQELIGKALPVLPGADDVIKHDAPASGVHASHQTAAEHDYHWSGGISLAARLKMPVSELAKRVQARIAEISGAASERGGLGPRVAVAATDKGFLCVRLGGDFLAAATSRAALSHLSEGGRAGASSYPLIAPLPEPGRRRIVLDFASPNYAKELHVGHFRSIVHGECLSRVLETLGHSVLRLSHVGDFGTPIGLVLAHLADATEAPPMPIGQLRVALPEIYLAAKNRAQEDKAFAKLAHDYCAALQRRLAYPQEGPSRAADPALPRDHEWVLETWKNICQVSRQSFDEIAASLNVTVRERGESFYAPLIPDTIRDLTEKGLVRETEGALAAFFEDPAFKAPFLVQKSDGAYLYSTTDVACLRQRISEEGADWLIYVTDASQKPHFKQVFELCKRAGYYDPEKVRIDHVGFGLVRAGEDRKKISSRDGTKREQMLLGLLGEAIEAAVQRCPEGLSPESVATLGVSALRYFDLSHQNWKDYVFDTERMFSWKGNTSSYIMYAYTRASSIIRRFEADSRDAAAELHSDQSLAGAELLSVTGSHERALAIKLVSIGDALHAIEYDLSPHHLCEHLYGIAALFHQFYQSCQVLDAPSASLRINRLLLCYATRNVLRQGMYLLGINNPTDRM